MSETKAPAPIMANEREPGMLAAMYVWERDKAAGVEGALCIGETDIEVVYIQYTRCYIEVGLTHSQFGVELQEH